MSERPGVRPRDWDRVSLIHFTLLALILVSLPSLDGAIDDPTASGGVLRSWAAAYIIAGAGGLLTQTGRIARNRLWAVVSWAAVAGGAGFFVTVSSQWQFWAVICAGALYSGRRAWHGVDDGI